MTRYVPSRLALRVAWGSLMVVFAAYLAVAFGLGGSRLLDFFSVYLSAGSRFPSSLGQLGGLGMQPMPDPAMSLAVSLRYWAETNGHAPARPEGAVA